MSQDTGELFQREKFIVPRKFIGTGNAGTSQIIVELVEYEALPRLRQALARIFGNPQKGSSHRSTFSGITQKFILTIIEFHSSL